MTLNLMRSPRFSGNAGQKISCCGPDVGPGTYEHKPAIASKIEESCVPFSSLQDKVPANRGTAAMTPGPGSYLMTDQPTDPASAKKTYSSAEFRSKSARMAPQTTGATVFKQASLVNNPGPGSYVSGETWAEPLQSAPKKGAPVLELTKTTPSIPKARAVLKDMHDEGTPTEKESKQEESSFEPKPKGVNFHVSASNRKLWEPTCAIENVLPSRANPGPGAYQRGSSVPARGPKSVFLSKTPMCHQRLSEPPPEPPPDVVMSKPLGVGPAAVNTFDSQVQRNCWNRKMEQPFKDTYAARCVPGPGYYHAAEEPESVEPVKKKIHGVHHPNIRIALNEVQGPLHAFNTTDIRPCNKNQKSEIPPPGAYNIDQVVGASMNAVIQEKALVGKKGVFGTTADRFFRNQFDQAKQLFGQGGVDVRNYDISPKQEKEDPNKSSVMFQSTTKRFEEDTAPLGKPPKHQYPGPCTYHPDLDVNYNSPFRHPRTEHLSFGSCKARFNVNEIFNGVQYSVVPGPGEYNLKTQKRTPGGSKVRAKRNLSATIGSTRETVGPGTYEVLGSMIKKSFNVS